RKLKRVGNVVLSAHPSEFGSRESLSDACAKHQVNLQGADNNAAGNAPEQNAVWLPPAAVCAASQSVGFSQRSAARGMNLLINVNGTLLPSLPLAILAATEGSNRDIVVASDRALALGERALYTGNGYEVLPRNYYGRDDNPVFSTVSTTAVLEGSLDKGVLQDRIVLIGKTAVTGDNGDGELLQTATALSNLLEGEYLLRPQWLNWLEPGMMAAILVVVLAWLPGMPAVGAVLVGLMLATIVLSIQAWMLVAEHIWIQLGTAALFAAIAVWLASALRARVKSVEATHDDNTPADNAARARNRAEELDLEFSVLRQTAFTDDTKEKMYQIAFEHGRAEEFARAERVLRYIFQQDPDYKDVAKLLKQLSGQDNYESSPQAVSAAPETKAPTEKTPASDSIKNDKQMLGRYTIEKKLGQGAMATVYLGTDSKIGRKVAIKTVALAEEFDDAKLEEARLQFLREAESAGRLNHPNIIAIYDVGEDQDVSYLAMEYFDGVSLLQHAQRDDLLPTSWVMELIARAADALDYAHAQGVVHRDIKPANIMYHAASDDVKLTDFGIARLTDTSRTKTGIILGTPSFMSPEQLTGSAVTGQSDLYSLGVTMYQLLTGVAPFRADTIPKLMDKIMNAKPRRVSEIRDNLPPCVDSIIETALAKDPDNRYSSGRAMAMALRDCAKEFGGYS
ncbi:MAG: protein kinase, partial [Gammaproteobacteria bacterium]|nr:protein kinase [Gammaproteobacteria bacterium]